MPQRPYIPIAGTWARSRHDHENAWYRRGSPFDHVMAGHGYERVEQDRDPHRPDDGYWSGAVNGLLIQWFAWWRDRHPAWRTGAETLRAFLRGRRRELDEAGGVTIVAHSHGGQVIAYALAEMHASTSVRSTSSRSTCRSDGTWTASTAGPRARCHHWVHLYSERGWKSRFRWLGNRFGPRTLDVARRNRKVTGGHSGILDDAGHIGQWDEILSSLPRPA